MNHKLLMVDDDKNILNIFKRQFEKKYNIDLVKNPIEGLEYVKKNTYSVIIADMTMPGMNGVEFLEKAKVISPSSVRIMLTGNADLDIAVNAINKGNIFRFLTKPCKKADFENVIQLSLKRYEEDVKLKSDSMKDTLTNIWNRRYFDIQVNKVFETSKRYAHIFSIVFIDLNNFKMINDKQGHDTGDKVLRLVAETLEETCRKTDIIARYGGDEFIILLEHEHKNGAIGLIQRLKKIINIKSKEVFSTPLSIAAGISTYPVDSENIKKLIKIADNLMYEDKQKYKKTN